MKKKKSEEKDEKKRMYKELPILKRDATFFSLLPRK
jgi:hypothetical protein